MATATHDVVDEELTKAYQGVEMATQDLRAALSRATATESLVLLPLIKQAAELSASIKALRAARDESP